MKTKEVFAVILFIGIYLNSGCKKNDNPVGPNDENAIMPLAIGNQWTFSYTTLDSLGTSQQANTIVWSITQDKLLQNEKWYFCSLGPSPGMGIFYTNRPDGLWVMGSLTGLMYKYPGNVNDSWPMPTDSFYVIKLVSTNTVVTVPQGTFTCYQYSVLRKTTGSVYGIKYFSPGVGFVKAEYYLATASGRTYISSRQELTGLILNETPTSQSNSQTWELTFQDAGTTPHTQTVKVIVTPFTYSGTFSETSDSQGLWMYDPSGNKCYKLPVGGNIVHDSPGDRWSFVGMGGGGCGMNTMGSNSSGTANGNFPNATYISNGVVTLTTTSPLGTVSGTVSWTGTRK